MVCIVDIVYIPFGMHLHCSVGNERAVLAADADNNDRAALGLRSRHLAIARGLTDCKPDHRLY